VLKAETESGSVVRREEYSVRVSVVSPVKNEAGTIERLLFSLAAQTVRPDEVIVVDGGSVDGTADLVEAWARRHRLTNWVRVLRLDEATPGKGRNAGVEAARNEWIAFTDAGIRVEPFWLERLTEVVRNHEAVDVVYGSYEPVTDNWVEECSALAYVEPKRERAGEPMRGPFIASSLMRRSVWRGVGGFPDYRAAENLVFMDAVERHRYKIAWAPRATVWWELQPTLGETFRHVALQARDSARVGQARRQHFIAQQYSVWLAFAMMAVIFCSWAWLLVAAGYGARVAYKIWVHREGRGIFWALRPERFAGVMLVLLIVDAAILAGWGGSVWQRGLRRASMAESTMKESR
jgi:glycosyltransferase involved in cell wall biosynthesis